MTEKKFDPATYTGARVTYMTADGKVVKTKEEADIAVVFEFKDGKPIREVFVNLNEKGDKSGQETDQRQDSNRPEENT